MRNARNLLAALLVLALVGGCSAVQNAQDRANEGIADAGQTVDDAAHWFQDQIPWNKRVDLLVFEFSPDATMLRAFRALDQVNPLEAAPKFLASMRGPYGAEPRVKRVECSSSGRPTGELAEKGLIYWDFELSRFRVDMENYTCYSTYWQYDDEQGLTKLDVTLRSIWPAVVGYAHYMSNPDGLSYEQRDVSCVAGLMTWQLTQPFQLADREEPPYLTRAQAQVILRAVKARKSQIGNRAGEGFTEHDTAGCLVNK